MCGCSAWAALCASPDQPVGGMEPPCNLRGGLRGADLRREEDPIRSASPGSVSMAARRYRHESLKFLVRLKRSPSCESAHKRRCVTARSQSQPAQHARVSGGCSAQAEHPECRRVCSARLERMPVAFVLCKTVSQHPQHDAVEAESHVAAGDPDVLVVCRISVKRRLRRRNETVEIRVDAGRRNRRWRTHGSRAGAGLVRQRADVS